MWDIFPEKAYFDLHSDISLTLICENDCRTDICVFKYGDIVREFSFTASAGRSSFSFDAEKLERGGYFVQASFFRESQETVRQSAFVIGKNNMVMRYGFSCDFAAERGNTSEEIDGFLRMHIDAIQFYDWAFRHDDLIPPSDIYSDLMGKQNCLMTVSLLITHAHRHGLKALGYGAVYASGSQYFSAHEDEGLYDGLGRPVTFIDIFHIMNISRGCTWRHHIIKEFSKAVADAGFDGIHMDTYGWPKSAFDKWGNRVQLEAEIPSLIDECHESISRECGKEPLLVFNNVGAWPVEETMKSCTDAVYCEIWPPMTRYYHLSGLMEKCIHGGKPVILACYPQAFRTDSPERALEGELLLSFVIAMHGASQLFYGSIHRVLTQGYYPDNSILEEWQEREIRRYQDFFVRFQDIMYDRSMTDVSLTHQDWDNPEYKFSIPSSASGEGGKVWCHIRENMNRKVIYFVNLLNNDDLWNEGKNRPDCISFSAEVLVLKKAERIWLASPENGVSDVNYTLKENDKGLVLHCDISLDRVAMLYIEEEK